jgi:hypothetical protein
MKKNIIACFLFAVSVSFAQDKSTFERFFTDKTMRVDYYHNGTKGEESISLDKVYEEGQWPGSKVNLLDSLNLGEYLVRVFDRKTNLMIYSRGYSTMFNEWQTTDEALAGVQRTFSETVRMPFPKSTIMLTVSRRDKRMNFREVFSTTIDPGSPVVNRERHQQNFKVTQLINNGPSDQKVDLLILGDGYTKSDMAKFRKDSQHFTDILFKTGPFKERRKDFNVWAVEVESMESGIDKPDVGVWKNTALGTSYYTFGSERYVLTDYNRELRNIASAAPYDFVNILVNDNRYGGGGIFNLYATCFAQPDKPEMAWQMDYVYVHEFGHSFAGLGDEYYSSSVAYNEFYPKGAEPWEPNVTALLDPKSIKWGSLMEKDTPVPTAWGKSTYDSLESVRTKLDRKSSDYYPKRDEIFKRERDIMNGQKYWGKVGVFEGAGYSSQGLYRPFIDCRMFTLSLADFDPVCRAAIERMVDFYAK